MNINIKDYMVKEKHKARLKHISPEYKGNISREEGKEEFKKLITKLDEYQKILYADSKKALLIVFQAIDAAGKDSTIRHVFGPLNPQGCNVTPFKAPSDEELSHDYLWRIHSHVPPKGSIGVFNRSHYEDVLVVKVKGFASPKTIEKRYDHINHFEKLLYDEGMQILKFYLHISKEYQKERLELRLQDPEKHWKFNPDDLKERERWDDYMEAFETALTRCSKKYAPWYIIPAETRWFRDLLIAEILKETLKGMELEYPKPGFDPATVVVK